MGLISKLFAKGMSSKLKNDSDLQNAVEKTEKSMKDTRDKVEKRAGGDKEKIKKLVSPRVRKALGFDY